MGVPAALQGIVGKKQLYEQVDGDRREAERRSHQVVARFHAILEDARSTLAPAASPPPPSGLLTTHQLVAGYYEQETEADRVARDSGAYALIDDPRAFTRLFADGYVRALRDVASGVAPDTLIQAVVGVTIDQFIQDGATDVIRGTVEWRALARQLAGVQIEVVNRRRERDNAEPEKTPAHPMLASPPTAASPTVSILGMLTDYLAELRAAGKGAEAERRWTPGFKALVRFLGHDDAARVTRADVIAFKDHLLQTLAPKTVRDTNVAALRAVFQWGQDNGRLTDNPARSVKVRLPKKIQGREKGFNDDEARALLKAASAYQPAKSDNPRTRESATLTAAKRWAPWLCAYTGARIAEITQLRGVDVREQDGIAYVRITPDAGSVKTGQYRDVPLHPHLVEMGFVEFARSMGDGPLFYDGTKARKEGATAPSKHVAGRVSEWIRRLGIVDADVAPNHGWRHRFKTIGIEVGMHARALDAIQGHAPKTAGDGYGDVTLKARAEAIGKHPRYKAVLAAGD